MPRIAAQEEFERLPLRVHTFLAGVPLHDVWSVDLPRWRAGITLDEFLRTPSNSKLDACGCSESSSLFTRSLLVRILLDIRFFVGRFFGWALEPPATTRKTFSARLTDTDHSRSLVMAGMRLLNSTGPCKAAVARNRLHMRIRCNVWQRIRGEFLHVSQIVAGICASITFSELTPSPELAERQDRKHF
jgi:hypothetical protein